MTWIASLLIAITCHPAVIRSSVGPPSRMHAYMYELQSQDQNRAWGTPKNLEKTPGG